MSNGTFTSPNYPGLYPRDTECHYLFYGRDGEYVELFFTYFHIDGVLPCDEESHSDYVEFSNYMPVDRKFDRQCGTIKNLRMKSDRKFFRVTFRSNDRYDATGFHATFQFNSVANHLTIRNVRSSAVSYRSFNLLGGTIVHSSHLSLFSHNLYSIYLSRNIFFCQIYKNFFHFSLSVVAVAVSIFLAQNTRNLWTHQNIKNGNTIQEIRKFISRCTAAEF